MAAFRNKGGGENKYKGPFKGVSNCLGSGAAAKPPHRIISKRVGEKNIEGHLKGYLTEHM